MTLKFKDKLLKLQRKVIFKNHQCPGDILMLSAAVRDLKLSHPNFLIDVRTSSPAIWENNPHLTKLNENDKDVEVYEVGYPIIHNSNEGAYHFIHGFRLDIEEKMNVRIESTKFSGDIHFSEEELSWVSMVQQYFTKKDTPYWLIASGGKEDYSAKCWIPEYAQEVVDHFKDKVQFVQFGLLGKGHNHPKLKGVIDLRGDTDLRMFMRLAYHADGIICPITFAMHLAAALPQKTGKPINKPCVVTAGGREPCTFTRYTHHEFLHTNGFMLCCDNGGCWQSRVVPLFDGEHNDNELCIDTVPFNGRKVQRCMHDFVTPKEVINSIQKYYKCGILKYLDKGEKSIEASLGSEENNKIQILKKEYKEMGDETKKANARRIRDSRFEDIFFVGKGIDIGAGSDSLSKGIFNNIESIDIFEANEGDAQEVLKYREKESYDFVYSSHCLEHVVDPEAAIIEWFSLVKPGGYMVITVPDEDLYEQGVFPSRWNGDHKHTFTIFKQESWSPASINVTDLIDCLDNYQVVKIDLLDHKYDYGLKGVDQTWGNAEATIEFVLKKVEWWNIKKK